MRPCKQGFTFRASGERPGCAKPGPPIVRGARTVFFLVLTTSLKTSGGGCSAAVALVSVSLASRPCAQKYATVLWTSRIKDCSDRPSCRRNLLECHYLTFACVVES